MNTYQQKAVQLALLHGPQLFVFVERLCANVPPKVKIDQAITEWFPSVADGVRAMWVCRQLGWIVHEIDSAEISCTVEGHELIKLANLEGKYGAMLQYE